MSDAEEGTGRQDEAIGRLRERFLRYWLAVVGRDVSLQLYDKTKASGVLVAIDSSQDQLVMTTLKTPMFTYPEAIVRGSDVAWCDALIPSHNAHSS